MKKLPMNVVAQFLPDCDIPMIYSAYCYETDPVFSWDSEELLDDFVDLYDLYTEICDNSKESLCLRLHKLENIKKSKERKSSKDCEDSESEWVKICFDKCNLQWYLVEGEPEGLKRTQQIMKNHNSGNVLALREYQINRGSRSEKLAMVLSMRKTKIVNK